VLSYGIGHQDANEALSISLVSPSKSALTTVATFHPKFTYRIFGEDEKIFGYKDLKIQLRYRANDMRPHLRLAYSKKFKPVGEQVPTDVAEVLETGGHLPKGLRHLSFDISLSINVVANPWCSCFC
jgi:histone acetyltransferase 1